MYSLVIKRLKRSYIMSSQEAGVPMLGADIIVSCLQRAGISVVFAYPGGTTMPLHQSLSHAENLRVVLPRHEQGGGFMAAGYARATGLTSVCMATSGPGGTNLVTAIADAYADSIPVVFITGQVSTHMIGRNAFQECDMIGMTRSVVKHSYLIFDVEDIPRIMAEAFHIANSGRPGPVLIDIPKDVQTASCIPQFKREVNIRSYHQNHILKPEDIQIILDALKTAERPCLYVGGGIISANASKALIHFAESFHIPVATTLMGVGAIPDSHPLSLQWLGMHGSVAANYAVNESDLLLAFGVRFDDRVTGDVSLFAPTAKIIHVDIDLSEINKNKPVYHGILANIKEVLTALNKTPQPKPYTSWFTEIERLKKEFPFKYRTRSHAIQPQNVVETLSRMTDGKAIIVPGVGQHQMFASQFYSFSYPRQLLTSAGLGTMGFGLPTAIGAQIAAPEKTVINVDGDGSFQMNIQELATVYAENIPVKMMIFNNQFLGMVAQWEDRFYASNRANTVLSVEKAHRPYPDFVQIAKGYGIAGREVYDESELEEAIREMLDYDGPFILDIHMPYSDHVLPMIPAGKSYKEAIIE